PLQEYLRRAEGMEAVAAKAGIRMIRKDSEYDPKGYLRQVVFREEQRCFLCYQLRLERTANIALKGGFDFFSSTLLFSKRQNHEMIKSTGVSLGAGKCPFYYHDFRVGWESGHNQAREMGIYRQNYCGCIYSEFERFQKKLS
ncbi:MAG: epoxyqueuosine reductase QueH, partial [Desulfonatronovibrionaceae bacterium]